MFGKSKTEKQSYGIVGLGRFGTALAKELAKAGADLLVLDHNEEKSANCGNSPTTPSWSRAWTRSPWKRPASRTVM